MTPFELRHESPDCGGWEVSKRRSTLQEAVDLQEVQVIANDVDDFWVP